MRSSYSYDNVGNLIHVTDPNSHTITNTYNLDNELTRATSYDGTHSDYGYDSLGRVITQSNGLGQTTSYAYDDINRVYTTTNPLNYSTRSQDDLVGNTLVITDANGLTETFGYDNAYQLQGITYHDGGVTPNVSYTYNSRGLRSSMTDGSGTSTYAYDSLNRLASTQDGIGRTIGYGYDSASRLTSIAYPDMGTGTRTLTRSYDTADRLTSITDWLSPTNTTSFGYNADGALTSINYPVGTNLTSAFGYNSADQITSTIHYKSGTPFLSYSYTRDNVGLLSGANETSSGNHTYQYDALYRLASDSITGVTGSTRGYTYDGATEITSTTFTQSGSTTTGTRTYDAANELKSIVEKKSGGSTTTRSLSLYYDNEGNRTSQTDNLSGAESRTYSYNQANELRLLNGVWQYKYNGDGLRISKYNTQGGPPPPMPGNGTPIPSSTPKPALSPGGSTSGAGSSQPAVIQVPITYTWDIGVEAAGLPLMLQDNNASYIYGPGGIILETIQGTSPATPYYYHIDQLGSVRAVTNSSGSTVDTYSYDPYGKTTTSSVSVSQPFGYAGEFTDSESGLLYLRARYYDPSTQQFLTVDPLLAWTEQGYAYAGGNPLVFTDGSGLSVRSDMCQWFGVFCASDEQDKVFGWDRIVQGMQNTGEFLGQALDGARQVGALIDPLPPVYSCSYSPNTGGGSGGGRPSGKSLDKGGDWEDDIRGMSGGKSTTYVDHDGISRQIDSLTETELIEAKSTETAKWKNFYDDHQRRQLRAQLEYAGRMGRKLVYWFKNNPSEEIRSQLESRGVTVRVGIGPGGR